MASDFHGFPFHVVNVRREIEVAKRVVLRQYLSGMDATKVFKIFQSVYFQSKRQCRFRVSFMAKAAVPVNAYDAVC